MGRSPTNICLKKNERPPYGSFQLQDLRKMHQMDLEEIGSQMQVHR